MAIIVGFGVRFVQMFAPISLFCVIIAMVSVFVGAFGAIPKGYSEPKICLVGNRLLSLKIGKNCNITQIKQVS